MIIIVMTITYTICLFDIVNSYTNLNPFNSDPPFARLLLEDTQDLHSHSFPSDNDEYCWRFNILMAMNMNIKMQMVTILIEQTQDLHSHPLPDECANEYIEEQDCDDEQHEN